MFKRQSCAAAPLLSLRVYIFGVYVWRHVVEAGPHQGYTVELSPVGAKSLRNPPPRLPLGVCAHKHTCTLFLTLSLSSWHFINEPRACMFGAYAALLAQVCVREWDISPYHMVIYSVEDLSTSIIVPLSPLWAHLWYVERTSAGRGISTGIMLTVIVDTTYLFCEQYGPSPHKINTSIVECCKMVGTRTGPLQSCAVGVDSLTAHRNGSGFGLTALAKADSSCKLSVASWQPLV